MGNILKTPSTRANIGYSGFDMSHLEKFSSTTGELLPVHYDILMPGDKVTCNIELKSRTMELASAAMVHINEHVDWFFVPLTQILTTFGDWYYGIQDFKTSFLDPNTNYTTLFPYVPASLFKTTLSTVSGDAMGIRASWLRLADMLGIPASKFAASDTSMSDWVTAVNPMFACAYQKIWMDYYRLSNYDTNNPKTYNLDRFVTTGQLTDLAPFQLRYRSADKDFFTNLVPSPLIGSASGEAYKNSTLYDNFNQWLVSGLSYIGSDPVVSSTSGNPTGINAVNPSSPTTLIDNAGYTGLSGISGVSQLASRRDMQALLSPSSIRTSFAVQKLLEITRRAGKHYDAQTLAHFGVQIPNGIAGEVFYLGSVHGEINIGDVIATATGSSGSASSVLGQVSGKGYGYTKGGDPIKFTAPCFGILMAIYSANVDRDYSNEMLDRLNTYINRSDWPTPEYENLGMQPIFRYQFLLGDNATTNSSVYGWQYRWSELKLKFNRVSGALQRGRTLDYWSVSQVPPWSAVGTHMYCEPSELDNIMLVPYGSLGNMVVIGSGSAISLNTYANMYSTDPLIHELFVSCKKASKMSTYGLENL